MSDRLPQRGMTLMEGIVAGALAVVLGLVILGIVRSSLQAHRKGQLGRTAQAGARDLLATVVSELRSSAVPPLTPAVSTSVFWPGVWGPEVEGASLGEGYQRELAGDPEQDQSYHRLLYVRTASNEVTEVDPLANYVLTELLVPESRPGAVERRIHKLVGSGLLKTLPITGADSLSRPRWLLDSAVLLATPESEFPDLIFDAGPDSRVGIRVSHALYKPLADPGRTRNPELYDPGAFRVEVVIAMGAKTLTAVESLWPKDEDWTVCRKDTTQIQIPAVRSSR